ncbi:hypothetical protein SAMN05518855_1005251 [Paenibacillus sp. CF384]|nr:hypothetical protein SAMN05518855_1005251 [Paenibacillus sp. CF384]
MKMFYALVVIIMLIVISMGVMGIVQASKEGARIPRDDGQGVHVRGD